MVPSVVLNFDVLKFDISIITTLYTAYKLIMWVSVVCSWYSNFSQWSNIVVRKKESWLKKKKKAHQNFHNPQSKPQSKQNPLPSCWTICSICPNSSLFHYVEICVITSTLPQSSHSDVWLTGENGMIETFHDVSINRKLVFFMFCLCRPRIVTVNWSKQLLQAANWSDTHCHHTRVMDVKPSFMTSFDWLRIVILFVQYIELLSSSRLT